MILTGSEIKKKVESKHICIDDFDEKRLNSNSYNLRLSNILLTYRDTKISMNKDNPTIEHVIPETGFTLYPGTLYLGKTYEYTETHDLVPMVNGRSSIGRLGIFIHVTAGFGDTGFCGRWTLELVAVQPVIVFPYIEIAQIYYNTIQGEITEYNGKYQDSLDIQSSRLYTEFTDDSEKTK